jgi:N utilization substance protein B
VPSRRNARRIATDILFQADVTGKEPERVMDGWEGAGRDVPPFARELVRGVVHRGPEIDLLLEEYAQGWPLSRMAPLDRTILRLGVFELLHLPEVPASVAISEAVEAAAELSSEDSKRFVNGILGRIAREVDADED